MAAVATVCVVPCVHALCPMPEEMTEQAVHAEAGPADVRSAAAPGAAVRSVCVAPPAGVAKHGCASCDGSTAPEARFLQPSGELLVRYGHVANARM